MGGTSGARPSIWLEVETPQFPRLEKSDRADVCVVGAGIAGLTTAYLLARAGQSVIVLEDGTVVGRATLGAAYEGPPGQAHGGVVALLLDQVLGETAHIAGRPGFTAYLTINYRHLTRLGKIRIEAKAEPATPGSEHKTVVRGTLYTVDATGS